MTNYRKVCWYCGSKKMRAVNTWWQCNECGATWVDLPDILHNPVVDVVHTDDATGKWTGHGAMRRPSGTVTRSAAIARSKAKAKGTP